MLIHKYKCTTCGEMFEVRLAYGQDGAELSSPKCHTANPRRLLSSYFFASTSGARGRPPV